MIRLYILCGLVFVAITAPVDDKQTAPENESLAKIISNVQSSDDRGNYQHNFSTSNKISQEEVGTVVNEGQPDQHTVVRGTYTYTDPGGKTQMVRYQADTGGFVVLESRLFSTPMPESRPPSSEIQEVASSILGK